MKNIILLFLLINSIFSLQASCDRAEPGRLIENDSTFLSYWYFPKESYWIYKDSVTNQLDTFLVESTDIQERNDRYSANKFQFHVFRVINHGVVKTQVGRPKYYDESTYYYDVNQSWGMASSAIRLFYDKYNRINDLENILVYKRHYDSILIRNIIYYDVMHFTNKGQSLGDSIRQEYYARNIGVIKRVYQSNHVWELAEFQIAK